MKRYFLFIYFIVAGATPALALTPQAKAEGVVRSIEKVTLNAKKILQYDCVHTVIDLLNISDQGWGGIGANGVRSLVFTCQSVYRSQESQRLDEVSLAVYNGVRINIENLHGKFQENIKNAIHLVLNNAEAKPSDWTRLLSSMQTSFLSQLTALENERNSILVPSLSRSPIFSHLRSINKDAAEELRTMVLSAYLIYKSQLETIYLSLQNYLDNYIEPEYVGLLLV